MAARNAFYAQQGSRGVSKKNCKEGNRAPLDAFDDVCSPPRGSRTPPSPRQV